MPFPGLAIRPGAIAHLVAASRQQPPARYSSVSPEACKKLADELRRIVMNNTADDHRLLLASVSRHIGVDLVVQ